MRFIRELSPVFVLAAALCSAAAARDSMDSRDLRHGSAMPPGQGALQRFEYKQYHMGVDVRIVAYAPNRETAERACAAAFARFAELDQIMSDYRPSSELMQLCAKAGGPPVKVSPDLFRVLEQAQAVSRHSDGAFDVTCGPLVALWRQARKTHILPTDDEIKSALVHTGWRKVRLDARRRTVQLLTPGMKLDLGGIGKGYADDAAQEALKKHGVTRALVEAGGDIVVSGAPPDAPGWRIEVANAEESGELKSSRVAEAKNSEVAHHSATPLLGHSATPPVLTFSDCAVSTSGDVFQSVEIGGKRYSHIVDPRTGWALTDRIQVTVVARDGLSSDPLSKVVSVLGPEGKQIAERWPGVRTVYVRHLGRFE